MLGWSLVGMQRKVKSVKAGTTAHHLNPIPDHLTSLDTFPGPRTDPGSLQDTVASPTFTPSRGMPELQLGQILARIGHGWSWD